jgi:hypothetical protein
MAKIKEVKVNPSTILIKRYLELKRLSPDLRIWSKESLKENEPRYIRYLQIQSLMQYLKINTSIKDFAFGRIKFGNLDIEQYYKLIKTNDHGTYSDFKKRLDDDYETNPYWNNVFSVTLNHLDYLHAALNINSCVLACSGVFSESIIMTNNHNKQLQKYYNKEIKILSWMINPDDKKETISYLIDNYDFPHHNLDEIDLEYI